jgi:Ca2+/Na+ antiporter
MLYMMVFLCFFNIYYKKIFKMPKEESEAINQRTDNTHPREKKDKQ